jgi:hypothetical protein
MHKILIKLSIGLVMAVGATDEFYGPRLASPMKLIDQSELSGPQQALAALMKKQTCQAGYGLCSK